MPLSSVQIITSIGQDKLTTALETETAVKITEVALGNGNGALYAPTQGRTQLKNERVRNAITRRHMSDDRTWRVSVEFGSDVPNFTVREIGFFDQDGDLIFLVAGTQMVEGSTGAYDLIYDAYLNLTSIKDGLVVVNAPDDALFDAALAQAHSTFLIFTEQLRQALAIEALQTMES